MPPTNGVDDRAIIQALMDEGGGEVVFGAGQTWTVDSGPGAGISPRSDTRIIIEDGALLRVKATSDPVSRLIDVGRDGPVRNVIIEGSGTLQGDGLEHVGSDGEWGHLIHITNGATNVRVSGPLVMRNAWGDAIYIGDGVRANRDVLIDGVSIIDCRREGIAPFWVDGCAIQNCNIQDIGSTRRTAPGSGIDCEPNAGQLVNDLTIERNLIERSAGCGIYVSANPGPITNLVVRANRLRGCGSSENKFAPYQINGMHISGVKTAVIDSNLIEGSPYDDLPDGSSGQLFLRSTEDVTVTGGRVGDGYGRGIYITGSDRTVISGVAIARSSREAIVIYKCRSTSIIDASIRDNAKDRSSVLSHVRVMSSKATVITNNKFEGNLGGAWVSIEHSKDTEISKNTGLGTPPAELVLDEDADAKKAVGGIKLE